MVVTCTNPVKIAIIDRASIEAPKSNSEEFTYQVGEEVGDDFNDDHKSEDVVLNCISQALHLQLTCLSSSVLFYNRKKRTIEEELQSFTHSPR